MRKFDGGVSTWPTFWDAFESSIHKNPTLAPIDKFNYLNSLLMKPALDAISGLSLSASNYEEAIAILKKRFGNKQQIINRHMDNFLNVSPVTNQDTRKLRELYDTLEAHVRSLKSLGIPSNSYGSLLSSIIMNKLPQELRLIISREIKDQDWQLDNIVHALEDELKARERAVPPSPPYQVEFKDSQRLRRVQLRLLYLQDIQDPLVHIVNRAIPLTPAN